MTLRHLRVPVLLPALCVAGSSLALEHEMQVAAAATGRVSPTDFRLESTLSLVTAVFAIAGIGLWLWVRRVLRSPKRFVELRPARSKRWFAGGLLVLLLWILPWLSLHDTHHALDPGDAACSIAQIAHGQFGGILPSLPTLAPPLALVIDGVAEPPALPSPSAPQPAARSPPV